MSTTVTMALPPSVNAIWRSNRGIVHKSPRYVSWLKSAGWELKLQRPKPIIGLVSVSIAAGRPDRRRRDLDNLSKSLLDLLVTHQVIEDDAKVVSITSRWCEDTSPGRIIVTVAAVN